MYQGKKKYSEIENYFEKLDSFNAETHLTCEIEQLVSSQMTAYGLEKLNNEMSNGNIHVLFKKTQMSTIYKVFFLNFLIYIFHILQFFIFSGKIKFISWLLMKGILKMGVSFGSLLQMIAAVNFLMTNLFLTRKIK